MIGVFSFILMGHSSTTSKSDFHIYSLSFECDNFLLSKFRLGLDRVINSSSKIGLKLRILHPSFYLKYANLLLKYRNYLGINSFFSFGRVVVCKYQCEQAKQ